MRFSQALQGYWLDKRTSFSPRTVEGYTYHFDHLVTFLGDVELDSITPDHIRRFLDWMHSERGLSMRTVHDAWIALKSFWTWAEAEMSTPHVLRGKVTEPKYTKRQIEPFTEDDVKRLVKAAEFSRTWRTRKGKTTRSAQPTGPRDRAILLTLLDCGIRASECCALAIGDYDADRGRLRIRKGKGNKERFVFLGDRARKAIWRYLVKRGDTRPEEALFQSLTRGHLTRDRLGKLVRRIAERAGVDNAHPHRFRHTFAIMFLRNGGNVFELQRLLGHETLTTVQIYARLAESDLQKAGRKNSPADNWRL